MMWSRALAGVLPGFFLSAALTGLVSWSWPGPWQATVVPAITAFFPVWMIVMGSSFLFTTGKRAWAWLGAAALVGMGALWALQAMAWIR
jgi:hypothetical protein